MAENDIGSAVEGNLGSVITDYSVDGQHTDGVTEQKETTHRVKNWSQNLGYYKTIPELRVVIDARADWVLGKGYQGVGDSKEMTEINLMIIKGIGNESFNTILHNMNRTCDIVGDSFAEIMRDDYGGVINIKVLDPETMAIIADPQGMILRYEQNSKVQGKRPKKYDPSKILHFSRNKIADSITGTSLVESLVQIILMINEAMADYKTVMHWHVQPRWKFKLKSDVPAEIAAYKDTQDKATATKNNIYEPMGVSESELISIPPNATLSPLSWLEFLIDHFYETAGVPKFVVGNSKGFTEAAEKIGYLAFQQKIEKLQLYNEEQVLSQLGLEINLEFPASLENELLSDNKKDVESGATKPSDTEAGAGE